MLLAALALAGCGAAGASPSASPAPSATPSPSAAAAAASPTPAAATPSACKLAAGASPPVLDPSLLSILPSTVAGVAVTQEPDSFGQAVSDPCFAANVDRAVFPIAVSGNDLVSGLVAHLRPGVYSDAFYSDWRSTYDEGACAQSSGVLAQASQTLGGRTIYVATCGGGLRVYHAYLPGKGVIVSLLSSGSGNFGEQLMAQLQG